MNTEKLRSLQISPEAKRRPQRSFWSIVLVVAAVLAGTVVFIKPWARDKRELVGTATASLGPATNGATRAAGESTSGATTQDAASLKSAAPAASPDSVLTVSGYIVNRERIEI